MKRFYVFIFACCLCSIAWSQCLTDLKKVLPDRDSKRWIGYTIALGGDYLVAASLADDTLGYVGGGAAYLYKKSPTGWDFQALLKPSNPKTYLQFGYNVAIDSLGETVAISSYGYLSGYYPTDVLSEVYVYQKPASGWNTMIETERVKVPDTLFQIFSISLSKDGLKLGAGKPYPNNLSGKAWLYSRNTKSEKFSNNTPVVFEAPNKAYWFGTQVAIDKDEFIVDTDIYNDSSGVMFVYKKQADLSYALNGRLSSRELGVFYFNGPPFKIAGNVLVKSGITSDGKGSYLPALHLFKKSGDHWSYQKESAIIPALDPALLVQNTSPLILGGPLVEVIDSLNFIVSGRYNTSSTTIGGASKGFVEVISKTAGQTWADSKIQTVYEEQLPLNDAFRQYASASAWNGSQFVFTPTLDASGSAFMNSITSLTLSNGVWGSLVKFKPSRLTSDQHYFGYSVVKANESLIIGSPHDNSAGPNGGAVYVYQKQNDGWVKATKIIPPWESETDTFFGGSISASDSVLAVGALNYGTTGDGKVILYERTGHDWSQTKLLQVIPSPSHDLYEFGDEVAIGSKVLAVSAFNRSNPGGTANSMAIFEKNPLGWTLTQVIDFHNAWLHSQTERMKIKGDSIYIYTGIGGYGGAGTGLYIYAKDPSGNWSMTTAFGVPSGFSSSEVSFEVTNDHVFMGLPGNSRNGKDAVGAVLVYSKNPGTVWPSGIVNPSSVVYPKDTIAFGYFGYYLGSIENSLLVGAPGTYYEAEGSTYVLRQKAGATYIITASDFYWKQYTQVLKLQGSEYNQPLRDGAGFSVASDYDYYFFGAPFETNDHGSQAGAVYTISTPPLVKLLAPVCLDSPPQQLFGYPFGGTWSGQGLVSGSNGVFDPDLVGPGKYLLSYKTPNCAYEGKLLVEVIGSPTIQLLTPTNLSICPTNPPTIKIQPIDSVTYQWHYRSLNGNSDAIIAGQTQPQLTVGLSGYYYCLVTKGSCSFPSETVTVQYETPGASIGPQSVICDITKTLTLTASPSGGTWGGQGIVNSSLGTFSPSNLSNGKHPITYTFKSANGCNYTLADTVLIDAIPKQTLAKLPGDYCVTGLVSLKVDPIAPTLSYQWNFSKEISSTPSVIDDVSQQQRTFVEAGYYQVFVSNKNCAVTTDKLKVGLDNDLLITLTPADSLITVCLMPATTLSAVASRENATFEWFYKQVIKEDSIPASSEASVIATKSGYYKVNTVLGFCESSSAWQHVKFSPQDSLWVPNVFTPNGDSYNDVFNVKTTLSGYEMLILNRYGQEVFSATASSSPWSGGDNPSGTYFWFIEYFDCAGKEKNQKGFVQLVR